MIKLVLNGIRARKLRSVLTAMSIVLGVAMISGTFVLTGQINRGFDSLFAQANKGTDAVVEPHARFGGDSLGNGVQRLPCPSRSSRRLRRSTRESPGRPDRSPAPDTCEVHGKLYKPVRRRARRAPVGRRQAVREHEAARRAASRRRRERSRVDAGLAEVAGPRAAGTVTSRLATSTGLDPVTVSGIVGFGEAATVGGATLDPFDPAWPTSSAGRTSAGKADDGRGRREARRQPGAGGGDRIRRVVDAPGIRGEDRREKDAKDSAKARERRHGGFLTPALLAFAVHRLFVGAFIIFNTFSIIVAQRMRELALLRAVGASRRQVLVSVLAESLVTGLVGSVAGVALGRRGRLRAAEPDGRLRAVAPRRRAGLRLPHGGHGPVGRDPGDPRGLGRPGGALAAGARRWRRCRPWRSRRPARSAPSAGSSAGLVTVAGLAALAVGLFGDGGVPAVAGGAVLVMLGFTTLAALVTRPILTLMAWPVARGLGVRGELAAQNALRNPRRTASTAAALMIGLGLVSFVVIFAASMTASTAAAIEENIRAQVDRPRRTDRASSASPTRWSTWSLAWTASRRRCRCATSGLRLRRQGARRRRVRPVDLRRGRLASRPWRATWRPRRGRPGGEAVDRRRRGLDGR